MFGWLIEIRNFFVAISLAWIGVSFNEPPISPDAEAAPDISSSKDAAFKAGHRSRSDC